MVQTESKQYRYTDQDLEIAREHYHYLRDMYYTHPNLWSRNEVAEAKTEWQRINTAYLRERCKPVELFFDDHGDI